MIVETYSHCVEETPIRVEIHFDVFPSSYIVEMYEGTFEFYGKVYYDLKSRVRVKTIEKAKAKANSWIESRTLALAKI
jgi:hypothetical protein